jgi:hypothetical protein
MHELLAFPNELIFLPHLAQVTPKPQNPKTPEINLKLEKK